MVDQSLDLGNIVWVLQCVDTFTEHVMQDSCHLKDTFQRNLQPQVLMAPSITYCLNGGGGDRPTDRCSERKVFLTDRIDLTWSNRLDNSGGNYYRNTININYSPILKFTGMGPAGILTNLWER